MILSFPIFIKASSPVPLIALMFLLAVMNCNYHWDEGACFEIFDLFIHVSWTTLDARLKGFIGPCKKILYRSVLVTKTICT